MEPESQTTFFQQILARKSHIINLFMLFNCLLGIFILIGSILVYTQSAYAELLYEIGEQAGKAAVIAYSLTLIPGIVRRFGAKLQIATIITLFRRYIGIATYLFALMHANFVVFINLLRSNNISLHLPLYQIMGVVALELLLLLFLTSNNFSVKKLGVWWKKIHSLTYVIGWFILIHLALLGSELWGAIIFGVMLVEWASLIYDWRKNQQVLEIKK